jgi:hypothetical protein
MNKIGQISSEEKKNLGPIKKQIYDLNDYKTGRSRAVT